MAVKRLLIANHGEIAIRVGLRQNLLTRPDIAVAPVGTVPVPTPQRDCPTS